ncbi:MAG: HDOD domain-containing protein [Acidobacteria bacterium]|nr:HDOD domain-containing protein [Acidobacteriota bacterium]
MLTILFVDDEPNILSGLQRMLRPMRHEWDLVFAQSGAEALAILAEKQVDVIISDMQMPGMDGAELLRRVSKLYPHIVRIIFSGYSDKAAVLRAISVAHQYLTKPCDIELLIVTVSQACALRYLLTDRKLRRLVAQLQLIPSMPDLYAQMIKEMQAPEPSIKKISEIMQQDIGMTVKVLQITNSAFFGLRRNITDVSEAASLLGLDILTSLVLSVGIFSQLQGEKQLDVVDPLWEHSLAIGNRAKAIASSATPHLAVDAFTAGLLHDIGRLVIAVKLPNEYEAIQARVKTGQSTQAEAEEEILGARSSAIGAYLLELWGLPGSIIEAVAFLHNPGAFESMTFSPLTAVYLANALAQFSEEEILAHPEHYLDTAYLQKVGGVEKLPLWIRKSVLETDSTV